jgi:hypothetical protein
VNRLSPAQTTQIVHFALSFSLFELQKAQPPRIFIRHVRTIRGFSLLSPNCRFLLNTERTENTGFLSDAPVNLGIPYTIRKKNLGIPYKIRRKKMGIPTFFVLLQQN